MKQLTEEQKLRLLLLRAQNIINVFVPVRCRADREVDFQRELIAAAAMAPEEYQALKAAGFDMLETE